ncbi:hypothetical protein ATO10_05442 [Actibacterium atlanticum]|uniref:Stress response protein n=1 Tax=Actibacterium atlanticum TaxID=1461693 RepID=A0A058ZN87_9RHOB|nr:hypothetical protein [Actibacterium atlanticum]KCV83028.1 hypothetical protein ATO10_05442 [Actibacterium atlanticum]
MARPDYLSQGEVARLFPVLATTSKEGRTTSIVLACMTLVNEFGSELLSSIGQRVGKRSSVATYTEIVFKGEKVVAKDRPDGLIVIRTGAREWRAMVEAKVGNAHITAEQIDRYRLIAKEHSIDCIITISNQFATTPDHHPVEDVRKSRSKIPVYHWSWMFIRTAADLLLSNDEVKDSDQSVLLQELMRFLTHESAGIKGFDRMPPEWSELNRHISAGGKILAKSPEAGVVLDAWHQETKDLSLILSRETETAVHQKLSRKHLKDPAERLKDELQTLREAHQLGVNLDVPDAAAPLTVTADLNRRTLEVGMSLRAPEDRKSSKARLNWLLRQLRTENAGEVFIKFSWPGRSEDTVHSLIDLREEPELCERDKNDLQVVSFHVYMARRLGAKFTQQTNFVSELETLVPEFYREIGQNLSAWRKPAPKIRDAVSEVGEGQDAGPQA